MTNQQIALEIMKQLGGNKFAAMTGACNIVAIEKGVQFKFKGSKVANCLVVKLGDTFLTSDLYTMEFWKVNARQGTCEMVKSFDGLYCDQIESTFSEVTGLATSL